MSTLRLLAALVAGALVLAGCTPGGAGGRQSDGWPAPDPSRPVVDLRFLVADDLRSVEGRERVVFTPDLPVCELVLRAWPNKPATARTGNALEVTGARVDGAAATVATTAAGAPDGHPGTLVEVALPACVEAGETVTAELDFTLDLGEATDERVGVSADRDIAWFATAFPLLAWERGRGWATDPAVDVVGEMTTSEAFDLRSLEVVAPSRYSVLGTGAAVGTEEDAATGTTAHRFADPAVRDVAVTVGDLETVQREAGGVRVHVGAPRGGTRTPLDRWADEVARSVRDVAALLGPHPYSDLWVSVLPDQTDGIELSGALQLGDIDLDRSAWLVTHEVAHMWFYGLVGNNQARHPWLDESFATAVQVVADGEDSPRGRPVELTGQVGRPMEHWTQYRRPSSAFVEGVYTAGGAAILEARRLAGADAFDEALRSYLRDNAHEIAEPADVEEAFTHLPVVLDALREAGALDPPGSPRTSGRSRSRRRVHLELAPEVGDEPRRAVVRRRRREVVGHLLVHDEADRLVPVDVGQRRGVVEGDDEHLLPGPGGVVDGNHDVRDLLARHHRVVLGDGPGCVHVVVPHGTNRVRGVFVAPERAVDEGLPGRRGLRGEPLENRLAREVVAAELLLLRIEQLGRERLLDGEGREPVDGLVDPFLAEHRGGVRVGLRRLDVDLGLDLGRVRHRSAPTQHDDHRRNDEG